VKEHKFFERRGADLYCTVPLSIAQATLGTELQVPDERRRDAEDSEGTQGGAVFRLKGKGLPDPHGGGRGDLYFSRARVDTDEAHPEERKLMEQLHATMKVENKPAERDSNIFNKVKDIFRIERLPCL